METISGNVRKIITKKCTSFRSLRFTSRRLAHAAIRVDHKIGKQMLSVAFVLVWARASKEEGEVYARSLPKCMSLL